MRYVPLVALLIASAPAWAYDAVKLTEKAAVGSAYRVVTESRISGELLTPVAKDKPPERIKINGRSSIDYAERILPVEPKDAEYKSLRIYEKIVFQKTAGDRKDDMTLRPAVRRQVLMKKGHAKVPFSPDGPLLFAEIELLRTDSVVPAMAGLLPEKEVRPGDTWKAAEAAVIELTGFEKVENGALACKLERVLALGERKRRVAQVSFGGTLKGINEDGLVRQQLTGRLEVDLDAQCITFLRVDGEHYLLDDKGTDAGKITGTFELERKRVSEYAPLSDASLRGVDLTPSEENTRLLYDSEEAGVRFVHSRNWRVVRTNGRQITLDEADGAGLLITLDTAEGVPTAARYLREAIKDLQDRGGKLTARGGPAQVEDGVDRFTLDAELGKEKVVMDYLVVRREKGGATFAARLPAAAREARMKELERLARSFTVTRRLDGK
jgi:hypothetical protein